MITSIPLRFASFCASCEEVFWSTGKHTCPVCESTAIKPLATWLNREGLPHSLPELAEFIKLPTPENIREMLGVSKR